MIDLTNAKAYLPLNQKTATTGAAKVAPGRLGETTTDMPQASGVWITSLVGILKPPCLKCSTLVAKMLSLASRFIFNRVEKVLLYVAHRRDSQIPVFDKTVVPWKYLTSTGKDL